MKKSWKRSLSLFLSAVLAGSLLPTATLAEEAAPQPLADTPSYEYVQATGELEDGIYAVYYQPSDSILYSKNGTMTTDQVRTGNKATLEEQKLTLAGGTFADSTQLWIVKSDLDGYTMQSLDSQRYLNLENPRTAQEKAETSEEPYILSIAVTEDNYYHVTALSGELALAHGSSGQYFTSETPADLLFFKQTEVTDPVDPEPDEPTTGAPAIPGYTQYTEATLDSSKYYLIVTVDSDDNLYALYANENGTSVNPGALNKDTNGYCTAALTVKDGAVTATYLADNTPLNVDSLRFTVQEDDDSYIFRSNGYGLFLNTSMFNTGFTGLSVSVSDGVYTIKNIPGNRVLSFNRVGDSLSAYPGEAYITDFWGPRAATGFSIYLYTQNDASVPVDKSQLQSVVDSVSALEEENYTTGSWAALQEVLASARAVLDDSDATQSEVNDARDSLTAAVAALEYPIAPPAELPAVTVYQKVTGPIQAGDIIAVVYEGTNSALYSSTNHTTTDQINASISGDQLTSTPDTILWTVVEVDGGLALQNQNSGKYLDLTELTDGSASGKAHISDVPVPLTFTETEGSYVIQGSENYLRHNNDTQNYKFFYSSAEEGSSMTIFRYTEVEITNLAKAPAPGTSVDQPFVEADTGSDYFRIPSLITLDNGWIVATADIRWRTTGDSPQNLDTIVSVSKDGGATWEWEVVNYFGDMADTSTSQESASFIDPSVLQASDGTVHLVVDACPSYCGLMSGNRMGNQSSGFDAEGRMIVALAAAGGDAPTNPNAYNYYVDINNSSAGQTISVGGEDVTLYPICAYVDDSESGYFVDAFLNLYYTYDTGVEPVYCVQLGSTAAVQSNLFYRNSQWKVYPVFYIMHRSATVTEDGLEWSEPQFLNIKLSSNEAFTGVCPGRGTATTLSDGTERLLFPLYDNVTGEKASVIYSDDGGKNWTRSSRVTDFSDSTTNATTSSESQIVVLPDGSLRMYSRNNGGDGYIIYADSIDGGVTWSGYKADTALYAPNSNSTMVSFINLNGTLTGPDGRVYENLILTSYPSGQSGRRTDGVVRIGSIDAETNEVTWLNDDTVRYEEGNTYAYSCLTQLPELDTFGLLYEHTGGGHIRYVSLTVTDLLGEGWTLAGDEYTITYQITGDYFAADAYATQTVRAGETVTALAAPVQSGYTFHGWTGVPEIMPSRDVTVTGYFTRDSSGVIIPTPPVTTTPVEDEEEIGDEDTPLAELPFTDVAADAWYADAVAYAVEHGLMNGTSASTFSPLMTTDRAMIVTILYRLEGEPAVTGTSAFSDVADGQWYTDAVIWAADNGIVTGYDTGAFGPGDTITREQLAAILYRYASYKGYDVTASADLSGYADQDQISGYALSAMQWANAESLITGTSDSTLTPGGSATRAEAATILMRFAQSVAG